MDIKQLKLANDEEIICEVIDYPDEDNSDMVIRRALKIINIEDHENNVRFYSFKPWMSFHDVLNETVVLNAFHVLAETMPSNILAADYASAMQEVERFENNKRHLSLDDFISDMGGSLDDLSEDDFKSYLRKKFEEQDVENIVMKDSADNTSNIIKFKPKGTYH